MMKLALITGAKVFDLNTYICSKISDPKYLMSKYRINRILELDKITCHSFKKKDFFNCLNDYYFIFMIL